jgi:hypothetical protein
MSVDNQDFAISSIMSLADAQRKDYTASPQTKNSSMPLNSPSFQQSVSRSPHIRVSRTSTVTLQNKSSTDATASESWKIPTSVLDSNIPTSISNSESFSQRNQIDTSQMKLGDMEVEHSDSNLSQPGESSPVPISGPIPSGSLPDKFENMLQPGMSGEIKDEASAEVGVFLILLVFYSKLSVLGLLERNGSNCVSMTRSILVISHFL